MVPIYLSGCSCVWACLRSTVAIASHAFLISCDELCIPGKAPHSAMPSRNRNVMNWAAFVMNAHSAATAPHRASIHPSHTGAPTLTKMRLLGIWNKAYPMKNTPAATYIFGSPVRVAVIRSFEKGTLTCPKSIGRGRKVQVFTQLTSSKCQVGPVQIAYDCKQKE